MKRKNISKFALLVSLLTINTTANSFYQCVPKKSWKRIAYLTPSSPQHLFQQFLLAGKYRVIAAGGGGEQVIKEFTLTTATEFKACAGEVKSLSGFVDGMGYDGKYIGKNNDRKGYGKGKAGSRQKEEGKDAVYIPGEGCYSGIYLRGTLLQDGGFDIEASSAGSYFSVTGVELVLKGGDLTKYDGYVVIDKWE